MKKGLNVEVRGRNVVNTNYQYILLYTFTFMIQLFMAVLREDPFTF